MNNKKTDISLIKKYLAGELDARAMHELERRALDDPFLLDALEGYQQAKADQQQHIADLQNRLHQYVKPSKTRAILWPKLMVAASLLFVIAIGGWWLLHNQSTVKIAQISKASKQDKILIPKIDSALQTPVIKPAASAALKPAERIARINKSKLYNKKQQNIESSSIIAAEPAVRASDTSAGMLKDVQIIGYPTARKRDLTASSAVVAKSSNASDALAGRVAGITVNPTKAKRADTAMVQINGKVLDKSGDALPGVSITITGTTTNAQTDASGNFSIKAHKSDHLLFNYIGYERKQVKAKRGDSLTVVLNDNNQALAEVVIGYGSKKSSIIKEAHPQNGWTEFNKYIENSAKPLNGKPGTVKLSFIVNADNTLSDFKIIRSLNKESDEKAIKLIKNGPPWICNSNGKPETVKLKIHFKPDN